MRVILRGLPEAIRTDVLLYTFWSNHIKNSIEQDLEEPIKFHLEFSRVPPKVENTVEVETVNDIADLNEGSIAQHVWMLTRLACEEKHLPLPTEIKEVSH